MPPNGLADKGDALDRDDFIKDCGESRLVPDASAW